MKNTLVLLESDEESPMAKSFTSISKISTQRTKSMLRSRNGDSTK